MADEREIVIRIIDEVGGSGIKKSSTKKKKKKQEKENNYLDSAIMVSLLQSSAKKIYAGGVSNVRYELDKYFNMTQNYMSKQQLQISLNLMNETISFGKSIYTAFKTTGPVGAAVVALFNVADLGTKIYKNYEQEKIKLDRMDNQLDFNRQRAGFSLTSGPTGENK